MQTDWKKRIATLTSNLMNPFFVSIIITVLICIRSTADAFDAVKWISISLALTILPVFLVIVYLVRKEKPENIFIDVHRQRHKIYLLSAVCVAVGCLVIYFLGAPLILVAAFVAGLVSVVVFMGINLLWKISVHTAFAAAGITMLIFLYGLPGLAAVVLLPLIGWSRTELEHHSPTQVAIGAVLAAVIVVVVFSFFGLAGYGPRA